MTASTQVTEMEPDMSRDLRPAAALALVAVTGLISAGCGSSAPPGSGSVSTAGQTATGQEKAVKFAECMRSNGVGDFPDPDPKGEFVYGVSVSPAVFSRAAAACKDLQPPGALDSKRTLKQQSGALKFAGCMRSNGVQDFPDPVNGEPLVDTTRIPSSNRPGGMTILNAAMQKCRPVLGLAAGGQ